ncbi:MAG: lipid uptake coordinator LucA [Mycobacterium sp.]
MGRTVAVVWHASFSIAAGVLYFFFVLPRWPELVGDTSHTLGTAMRIVAGALVGLAALPVVFTLLRTRRPEFGTPKLALSLRTSSIALHVLAGVLIVGAAISEIWLSLDSAGQWLFGSYGAAAAIALLGIFAFYLAFVAELPPPPPKPLKPKKAGRGRRGRRKGEYAGEATEKVSADATDESAESEDETTTKGDAEESSESESDEKPVEVTAESAGPQSQAEEHEPGAQGEPADQGKPSHDEDTSESTNGRLRNRRRRRLRGGVAVED